MAKRFEKVSVSDDEVLESEDAVVESGDGSAPPAKTVTAPRSTDGRRPKKSASDASTFARIAQFLHDTRAEMRRVSWPTLVMVRNTTLITLVAVIFFAVYLFAVDRVWSFLIDNLRGWLGG